MLRDRVWTIRWRVDEVTRQPRLAAATEEAAVLAADSFELIVGVGPRRDDDLVRRRNREVNVDVLESADLLHLCHHRRNFVALPIVVQLSGGLFDRVQLVAVHLVVGSGAAPRLHHRDRAQPGLQRQRCDRSMRRRRWLYELHRMAERGTLKAVYHAFR